MNRTYYKLFLSCALILLLGVGFIRPAQAETASPSIADATPALLDPTPTAEAESTATAESATGESAASATYYDKGAVEKFDGTPGSTGNSAGEIVFMLAIFLFCLFFVVEAIVHWMRKRKRHVRPKDWDR